jgi:hypothetical protein
MWGKLVVAIVSVVVGSLLTLLGQPFINEKIQEKRVPILVKEVYRPDISGLSAELQKRVTILPVKYTIENKVGGTAKNLTISINSDSPVRSSELRFGDRSEAYSLRQITENTIKIDVPLIRPGGIITFELLTGVNNNLRFQELAEEGKILTTESFAVENKKSNLPVIAVIAIVIVLWAALVTIVLTLFRRIGTRWRNMEIGDEKASNDIREPLVKLIIILIVYDLVVGSLGPISGFLPVPRLSFTEMFYAFCLYLLITRYKLIEAVLRKLPEKTAEERSSSEEKIKQ